MSCLRVFSLLTILMLFTGAGGFSQEKKETPKDSKETPKDTKDLKDPKDPKEIPKEVGKLKGNLPQHWAKIGLTDAQRQDVYKVQSKYRDEIDKLNVKIDEIKVTQKKEMEKVLTDEQKKRLREILTGEKPKDK